MSPLYFILLLIGAYLLLGVGFVGLVCGIQGSGLLKKDFKNPLFYLLALGWVLVLVALIPKAVYRLFFRVGFYLGSKF